MKLMDKMRMVRPTDAFLPGAFLLASVLGKSTITENAFLAVLFSRLFALASARGLRQAFSEQPSMRRAQGSVKAALLLQAAGFVALMLVDAARNVCIIESHVLYACIALFLNVEHVFYEYLYAAGDGYSALMSRAITAALTAGGLLMTSANSTFGALPYGLEWPLAATALAAGVSAVTALLIDGTLKGKLNDQLLKCAPLSMLQSVLYPIIWLALIAMPNSMFYRAKTSAPFFAGLIIYELCRAPFRRTPMESRAMNKTLLITAAAALGALVLCVLPFIRTPLEAWLKSAYIDLPAAAIMVIFAAGAGFAAFGNIEVAEEDE